MANSSQGVRKAEQSGLDVCEAPKTVHGIAHLCDVVDRNSDSGLKLSSSSSPSTYEL